jgi:hypothetical protein
MSMRVPQVVLAALCVLVGIFPQTVLRVVGHALEGIVALPAMGVDVSRFWGGLRLIDESPLAFWSPLAMLAVWAVLALLAYVIQRAGAAETRSVPVWFCGEEHAPATVRYPASSFYLPFKHAFEGIYPSAKVRAPKFPAPVRRALDFDRWLYQPAANAVDRAADRVSRTHVGIPQIYLLWIVVGAVVVTGILLFVRG